MDDSIALNHISYITIHRSAHVFGDDQNVILFTPRSLARFSSFHKDSPRTILS